MQTHIKLRPHHLLCLLTYIGKGYSTAFTANYDAAVKKLKENNTIEIVAGPDDICQPMLADKYAHCKQSSIAMRDQLTIQSLNDLWCQNVIELGNNFVLDKTKLDTMRQAFKSNQIRKACLGCQWSLLCTQIANENFYQAKLNLN